MGQIAHARRYPELGSVRLLRDEFPSLLASHVEHAGWRVGGKPFLLVAVTVGCYMGVFEKAS